MRVIAALWSPCFSISEMERVLFCGFTRKCVDAATNAARQVHRRLACNGRELRSGPRVSDLEFGEYALMSGRAVQLHARHEFEHADDGVEVLTSNCVLILDHAEEDSNCARVQVRKRALATPATMHQ
jgi:hypothetical protein